MVYAVNSDAPQHAASRALLETALDPEAKLYVTSQILCDFLVITSPKRIAVASSPDEALQMIRDLLDFPGLQILAAPAQAVAALVELLKRHSVTGGRVFDLQIIATMQATNFGASVLSTLAILKDSLSSQLLVPDFFRFYESEWTAVKGGTTRAGWGAKLNGARSYRRSRFLAAISEPEFGFVL